MDTRLGRIHNGDCVAGMNALPQGSIDLVFADPPFNIGYKYDVYEDKKPVDEYLAWSNEWMTAVHRALKPDGTFWLAIGDDFAAELKIEARKIGFHCRSWVIWYYTFGVNCTNKFTRSHTHLFHFVKDPQKFTFRADDLNNRVPSARMLVYNDKRAKGSGRLPDDTWIIPPEQLEDSFESWAFDLDADDQPQTFALRPQELDARFDPSEDTWYIPRVAGTFKERAGFHGCQMPEQLLGRIIRTCSEENDIVMDPFSGSASTLVTAKKLNRRFIGCEMSKEYAIAGRARLSETRMGDRLDGSPEPTMDSFRKSQLAKTSRRTASKDFAMDADPQVAKEHRAKLLKDVERGVIAAFATTHQGRSTDLVLADLELGNAFADECQRLGLPGSPLVWNRLLLRIRKRSGQCLPPTDQQFSIPFDRAEAFLFASEIAWKTLIDDERAASLEDILCDPHLASEFDSIAGRFAPGFSSLEYRWGALRIRKFAKTAKEEAAILREAIPKKPGKKQQPERDTIRKLPAAPGVYLISNKSDTIFISGTLSIRKRVEQLFYPRKRSILSGDLSEISVQYYRTGDGQRELYGWTSCFITQARRLPRFNVSDLRANS